MNSRWVRNEIRFFLEKRGASQIQLALTHGTGAETEPEEFFAPEILNAGLHEVVWYDLRSFYREGRKQPTARDLGQERLRLVASLHGLSASDIEPLWAKERQRNLRNRYAIAAAVAILTVALGAGLYSQRLVANEQARLASVEKSMRFVSKAYRNRYVDPFTATADIYRAGLIAESVDNRGAVESALEDVHRVLLNRREVMLRERKIVKSKGFSFMSQAGPGESFGKPSKDGEHVLVIRSGNGGEFSPDVPGEVYLHSNRTLDTVRLVSEGEGRNDRLEFADFIAADKVFVARGFYAEIFTFEGKRLAGFQLMHTKTPVTAAGGMLDGVHFIAGNGSGLVWVQEYGHTKKGIESSPELSAVKLYHEKRNPDAVVDILVDPKERVALNVFQSGRIDLFALAGARGSVDRRPILAAGGGMAGFRPGDLPTSFALASVDPESGIAKLTRWDLLAMEPEEVGSFELPDGSLPIDYFGFSADGEFLVGLDTEGNLFLWDYQTRKRLLKQSGSVEGLAGTPIRSLETF